jgi:hypothetical protein
MIDAVSVFLAHAKTLSIIIINIIRQGSGHSLVEVVVEWKLCVDDCDFVTG